MSDFADSVAQEDVSFITQVTRVTNPGDNFSKLLVFIEGTPDVPGEHIASGRFIGDVTAFIPLAVGSSIFVAEVTKDTFFAVTTGLLRAWLTDFFASGHEFVAYLAVYGEPLGDTPLPADITAAEDDLASAYAELVSYAYHKTICAGSATSLLPALAVKLSKLCAVDKDLLSSAPYYPLAIADASNFVADPIYAALKTADASFAQSDAFITAHADATKNGSLVSLGLSLSLLNSTGTPIGNNIDFWANALTGPSGPDATSLSRTVRTALKAARIAHFKYVGDGTMQVVGVGVLSLAGRMMQAYWIVNYINYMCKVLVANYITRPNMKRDVSTYSGIINIMTAQIAKFGVDGSGRLENVVVSAPSFVNLPAASGDEIIIPKAWSAEYVDQVHHVQVYGNLIISE